MLHALAPAMEVARPHAKKRRLAATEAASSNAASQASKGAATVPAPASPASTSAIAAQDAGSSDGPSIAALAKQLRTAVTRTLLPALQTIDAELFLLQRIHYKHGVQFRSAKWYQAVEGVRRCAMRVTPQIGLGKEQGEKRGGKSNGRIARTTGKPPGYREYDYTLGLPNGAATPSASASAAASAAPKHVFVLHKSPARDVFRDSLAAYDSMWSDPSAREDVKALRPSSWQKDLARPTAELLPAKKNAAPRVQPSAKASCASCSSVLALSVLLMNQLEKCETAFAMLANHLRSPPSPTFVPIVMTLCALVASIYDAAMLALTGASAASAAAAQDIAEAGNAGRKGAVSSEKHAHGGLMDLYATLRPLCAASSVPTADAAADNSANDWLTPERAFNLAAFVDARAPWPPAGLQTDKIAASPELLPARIILGRATGPALNEELQDLAAKEGLPLASAPDERLPASSSSAGPARAQDSLAAAPAWLGATGELDFGVPVTADDEDFGEPV